MRNNNATCIMTTIERFSLFYQELAHANLDELSSIYAQDVELIDPVGTHKGLPALRAYFENLLTNTEQCQFTIHNLHQTQIGVDTESAFLTWTMNVRHPKFARPIVVDGSSELRLSKDRIVYHRDYYDLGQMVYEHIPLLGRIIKKIKSRLKG